MPCMCPMCGRPMDCGERFCVLCDIEREYLGKPYAGMFEMFECEGEHCDTSEDEEVNSGEEEAD